MNVLYIGVANPVKVSVPGVAGDKVSVSFSHGSISPNKDGYIVRPSRVSNNANVTVFAEIDGEKKRMGSVPFRVKDLPTPIAKVGGMKGGSISGEVLKKQRFVVAEMEDFDFDLKVNVTRFKVSATIAGFLKEAESYGNQITAEQQGIINQLSRNSKVYFEDIKAKTPGGTKNLSTISFRIQ